MDLLQHALRRIVGYLNRQAKPSCGILPHRLHQRELLSVGHPRPFPARSCQKQPVHSEADMVLNHPRHAFKIHFTRLREWGGGGGSDFRRIHRTNHLNPSCRECLENARV